MSVFDEEVDVVGVKKDANERNYLEKWRERKQNRTLLNKLIIRS